ncbi:MAG: AmmeMemoRadiSam system protein B [bacterium]
MPVNSIRIHGRKSFHKSHGLSLQPEKTGQMIRGLIVPHAGWVYSGKTAFLAFRHLDKIKPERIALLGPAHAWPLQGMAMDSHDYWMTPLGEVSLFRDDYFPVHPESHQNEHALEVQMPFISYYCKNASVLPLLVGKIDERKVRDIALHLSEKQYFIIISTDLSHFYSLSAANERDLRSIESIQNLSAQHVDACGINPLRIAMEYCKLNELKPRLIDYTTSADYSGIRSNVVGYASFYF